MVNYTLKQLFFYNNDYYLCHKKNKNLDYIFCYIIGVIEIDKQGKFDLL